MATPRGGPGRRRPSTAAPARQGADCEQCETANFDGAQYGVPFYNSIHVLLWSKPLLQAVGLSPDKGPQSWTELRDAARRTAKPDENQWGYKLFDYGTREAVMVWWLRFAWTNGGRLFDQEASKVTVNSEPCIEALQLFTDMLYKDRSAAPPERNADVSGPKGNVALCETGAYGMVGMDKQALDEAARKATQFVQENGSTRLTRHLLKDK
jgi:ABC-type glycerol-3-phosphate transport system substrate-binding protein